tara:strand:- start:3765 stop:3929 length:165 start_codon:yes stop_codon:yes gene_type:complete
VFNFPLSAAVAPRNTHCIAPLHGKVKRRFVHGFPCAGSTAKVPLLVNVSTGAVA